MVKKEFIKMKIKDLIPYENNPRHNEEAVPDVAESIRQCGDLDPIEVDENNVILSGHTAAPGAAAAGLYGNRRDPLHGAHRGTKDEVPTPGKQNRRESYVGP